MLFFDLSSEAATSYSGARLQCHLGSITPRTDTRDSLFTMSTPSKSVSWVLYGCIPGGAVDTYMERRICHVSAYPCHSIDNGSLLDQSEILSKDLTLEAALCQVEDITGEGRAEEWQKSQDSSS